MYHIVLKLGRLKILDARLVVEFEDAMDYLVNLGVIDALRCLENNPNSKTQSNKKKNKPNINNKNIINKSQKQTQPSSTMKTTVNV